MKLLGIHDFHPHCECNDCENYILACEVYQLKTLLRRMTFEFLPVLQAVAHQFWHLQKIDGDTMDFETAWRLHGKR